MALCNAIKFSGAAALALAAAAFAQPVPDVDLGSVANPSTSTGTLVGFTAAGVKWIKFTVPTGATLAGTGYLDIDTNGGSLTGGDSHIGLFRADGTFLDSNDDSGPGLYSMLSYGRTTPSRPGLAFTGNATSNGSTHTGSAGAADITAGTYYLAVTGFGGNSYANGFVVNTTHTRTGDVNFRIDYVGDLSSIPPSCSIALAPTSGPIGTSFVATCTVTPGSGPVSTGLAVSLNAATVDGGTVALLDNGVAPDAVAGDNVFTGNVTVGPLAAFGAQTLTSTVSDAQVRSSTCTANFTVVAPPPANDDCTNPATAVTGSNAYDTNGATTSTPASTCGAIGTDIWYTWNSGPGGQTTISTCGFTTVDTAIAVYSDCATSIACNDDGCGLQSTLTFCALPNTNYLLRVGDFAGGTPHVGTFLIDQAPGGGAPTINAAVSPGCGGPGTSVTITANLAGAGCPAQTLVSASADASAIDGGSVTLLDDGVAPDITAADGIFTGSTTVGANGATGNIVVTGNFSGGATATSDEAFTVPSTDDAGESIATARIHRGDNSALASVSGVIADQNCGGADADMHGMIICDPANFSASTVGGTTLDTQLFLFGSGGVGIAVNDDEVAGTTLQSTLTNAFTSSLSAGYYVVAVSTYNRDPQDASLQTLWLNTPFASERAPDGLGAANPVDSWFGGGGSGPYTIALTGTCSVCVADFDGGAGDGIPDGGVGIEDLLYYLSVYDAGVSAADVDDGSGTGTTDGGVGIEDLLYYLGRYDLGC